MGSECRKKHARTTVRACRKSKGINGVDLLVNLQAYNLDSFELTAHRATTVEKLAATLGLHACAESE